MRSDPPYAPLGTGQRKLGIPAPTPVPAPTLGGVLGSYPSLEVMKVLRVCETGVTRSVKDEESADVLPSAPYNINNALM